MSGPNPNADCVFPFNYKGRQYNGCPVDPDDSSKRWCSTKVDSDGNHVGGQGQYGHCGRGCPSDTNGTPLNNINRGGGGGGGSYSRFSSSTSSRFRLGRKVTRPATSYVRMRLWLNFDELYKKGSSTSSGRRRCRGSEECRSVGECALRFSVDELDRRECRLDSGGDGLCCSDLTTNARQY